MSQQTKFVWYLLLVVLTGIETVHKLGSKWNSDRFEAHKEIGSEENSSDRVRPLGMSSRIYSSFLIQPMQWNHKLLRPVSQLFVEASCG